MKLLNILIVLLALGSEIKADDTFSFLEEAARNNNTRLNELVAKGTVTDGPAVRYIRTLLSVGISKIIYSIPFPETKAVTEFEWRTMDFDDLFDEPHLMRQDSHHARFVNAYRRWASPVIEGLDSFPEAHPSAGSAEAIKDTLSVIHGNNPELRLHMFEGDYEGVTAYATSMGFQVVKHFRTEEVINSLSDRVKAGEIWYISQPSALDGNLWNGYDDFMQKTEAAGLRVLVDTAYVGTVTKNYKIKVDYPHIDAVFFSLSKPFGVYYQRIGGVFVKKVNRLLQGNVWTKNLPSLRIGEALMKRYGVFDIARKYQPTQQDVIDFFSRKTGIRLIPSDVITVAHLPTAAADIPEEYRSLCRGNPAAGFFRPCLVPSMIALIKRNAQCGGNMKELAVRTAEGTTH